MDCSLPNNLPTFANNCLSKFDEYDPFNWKICEYKYDNRHIYTPVKQTDIVLLVWQKTSFAILYPAQTVNKCSSEPSENSIKEMIDVDLNNGFHIRFVGYAIRAVHRSGYNLHVTNSLCKSIVQTCLFKPIGDVKSRNFIGAWGLCTYHKPKEGGRAMKLPAIVIMDKVGTMVVMTVEDETAVQDEAAGLKVINVVHQIQYYGDERPEISDYDNKLIMIGQIIDDEMYVKFKALFMKFKVFNDDIHKNQRKLKSFKYATGLDGTEVYVNDEGDEEYMTLDAESGFAEILGDYEKKLRSDQLGGSQRRHDTTWQNAGKYADNGRALWQKSGKPNNLFIRTMTKDATGKVKAKYVKYVK